LRDNATGVKIDSIYSFSGDNKTLTIQPLNTLKYNSLYTVSIHSNALDMNGKRVYGASEWTFLTGIVPPNPQLRQEKTLVGAIRWDAWVGDLNSAGLEVEKTLGPEKYHFRLPFFANILGPDTVEIRGATQDIMDQEIAYAKAGGIDYWAFLWYPPGSGLDDARNLYLSSSHKDDVKWSAILHGAFKIDTDLPYLVEQFKTSNYQKVQGNRPLIYLFTENAGFSLKQINLIRAKTMEAGLGTPYIVMMGWGDYIADYADQYGADAIGSYSYPGTNTKDGIPYSQLADMEKDQWNSYKNTGKQVVLTVTTGKDKRPRYDNPVSWEPNYQAFQNMWVEQGTPEEIAAHLGDAVNWNNANPSATQANTVLIYAWNENDEGGWIVPTLFEIRDSGRPLRLDAIRNVLDKLAPVTIASLLPAAADGSNGWYTHAVRVSISALDTLSGVAKTEYSLDGGSTWQSYTTPVTFNQDGKYTLSYRSTDHAGNVEEAKTVSLNLDSSAPQADLTQSGNSVGDVAADAEFTFELSSRDSMSGVLDQELTLDGIVIANGQVIPAGSLAVGTHTIAYRVTDVAGHVTEASVPFQVKIVDASVPGLPLLSSNSGDANGLQGGNYTVTMNMWWGQNGSQFKLYENGVLVSTTNLAKASFAAQAASWAATGNANGTYTYVGELINSAGKTVSQPLVVKVTDAAPGKAVLAADNWDGDGKFTVSMNLWWGTNATEYRLYENGVLIDSKSLTAATPNAQNASTVISGRHVGVYEYRCELVNAAGATSSDKLTVKVTK
jgi:hypothetical protein